MIARIRAVMTRLVRDVRVRRTEQENESQTRSGSDSAVVFMDDTSVKYERHSYCEYGTRMIPQRVIFNNRSS